MNHIIKKWVLKLEALPTQIRKKIKEKNPTHMEVFEYLIAITVTY